jgi:hypothetical protein
LFAVTGISLTGDTQAEAAPVEAQAEAAPAEVQTKTASRQYMVGDSECACDWGWEDGPRIWRMSSKEGVTWHSDGPLSERGREMLLKHFGLKAMTDTLPIESIRGMSPAELIFTRRRLEDELGPMLGDRLDAVSEHPTFKVRAEEVA